MNLKVLHIVDGESTGGTLKASGIANSRDILSWKDALYTGPVPIGLSLKRLSRLRSLFWSKGKRRDEFEKRDAHLLRSRNYDEVVLWFGRTSLCQLSLAQILAWFSNQDLDQRLSLVAAYGGILRPEQLAVPYGARRRITGEQVQLARRFWTAFTSPSPLRLERLLKTALRPLPELRDTINELLQEYPNRSDGLSRLERKLLGAIAAMGSSSAAFAVGSVIQQVWIGDTLLFDMLRCFVAAPRPVLHFAGPFTGNFHNHEFNRAKLRLTSFAEQVLEGKADHVAANGIDRWIGGVHLLGRSVKWRWDERRSKIVRATSKNRRR